METAILGVKFLLFLVPELFVLLVIGATLLADHLPTFIEHRLFEAPH